MKINKKIAALATSVTLFALPLVTLADINPGTPPVSQNGLSVIQIVNLILDFVWPIFIGFAVLMFLLAGFYFMTAQGSADKVAEARNFVLWAVVGVVVGLLAFSIPFIIRNTLGL